MLDEPMGELIERYEAENAGIVATVAVLPGPAGTLARLPAISMVLHNHVAMLRALASACGRPERLTPKLTVELIAAAMLGGGLGVASNAGRHALTRHGAVLAIRGALRRIALQVSYKVLKAWLSAFALGVGTGALVVWARRSTRRLAMLALDAFGAPGALLAPLPAAFRDRLHSAP